MNRCKCCFITLFFNLTFYWIFIFGEGRREGVCVCEIKKNSLKLNVESESSLECWEGEIGTNRKLPGGQLTVLVVMRLSRAAFTPESPWVLVGLALRWRLTQVLGTGQKVKLLIVVNLTSLSYNKKLKKINISAKVCLQSNLIFYIIYQYCHVHKCTFPHSTLMQDDFINAVNYW